MIGNIASGIRVIGCGVDSAWTQRDTTQS